MRRRAVILVFLIATLIVFIWRPWRSRFGQHFDFPLPQSAAIENYHHTYGLDSCDVFEFAVQDDALRDAIVKAWRLDPLPVGESRGTASTFSQAGWWPGVALDRLPERYYVHEPRRFRYLWVDRARGRLYAMEGEV